MHLNVQLGARYLLRAAFWLILIQILHSTPNTPIDWGMFGYYVPPCDISYKPLIGGGGFGL